MHSDSFCSILNTWGAIPAFTQSQLDNMGILADRMQSIIDEMKRVDEEFEKRIQQRIAECYQLIDSIDDMIEE